MMARARNLKNVVRARVDDEMKRDLEQMMAETERSEGALIRLALREMFDRNRKRRAA